MQAQPKHLGAYVLSGPVLAGLTEAYVQAINNGAVPTIATAWQVRLTFLTLPVQRSGSWLQQSLL